MPIIRRLLDDHADGSSHYAALGRFTIILAYIAVMHLEIRCTINDMTLKFCAVLL